MNENNQHADAKHTPEWRVSVNPMTGWQVHFGPKGTLHGYCTLSYGPDMQEKAELIARAPALLSEVATLRDKQAELIAELKVLNDCAQFEREELTRFKEFNLRTIQENKRLREALEEIYSMKGISALPEHLHALITAIKIVAKAALTTTPKP